MKLRDFTIGWRLLAKDPTYSSVVILGLSIAFAACFLVLTVLLFSFSFDKHIPGVENVYIAKSHPNWFQNRAYWRENVPMPAKRSVEQSGLPVSSTRVMNFPARMQVIDQITGRHIENVTSLSQSIILTLVDPAFPDIFGVQTVAGDLKLALSRPDAIALTQEIAEQLFHEKDATKIIGKNVEISGNTYQVLAILRNSPETTSVPYEALAGVSSSVWSQEKRTDFSDNWNNFEGRLYFKLAAGVSPKKVAQIIKDAVTGSPLRTQLKPDEILDLGKNDLLEVELGKLTDSYLDDSNTSSNRSKKFDVGLILALGAMTSLILLLAMSNFISLAITRTTARQREIAVRKVMGARGGQLLSQITTEAILTALLAAILGLLIAWLLLPGFSYFINFKIENLLTLSAILKGCGLASMFAVVIGSIAGLYPALLAIKTPPAVTLNGRGNSETTKSNWLRHTVVVGQFAIGMCFAGVALTFAWQTHFARTADRGFNPDPVMVIQLSDDMTSPANQSFRDAVAQLPDVTAVSVVHDMIGQTLINRTEIKRADGSKILLRKKLVDSDYFKVFNIHATAGRLFNAQQDSQDNSNAIVIEAAAAQALGFASPEAAVGQFINMDGDNLQIVGITPTILLDSILFSEITQPILYRISRKTETMLIRTNANFDVVKAQVEKKITQHLPSLINYIIPLKVMLDLNIQDGQMIVTVISIATIVATLMAAFGMYISSATSLKRKSREIVMRKLYGAQPLDIAKILGREFALLICIAAGIGLPVAYLLGHLFVEHSSKPAPVGVWPVLAAFAGAIVVTLIASYRNTAAAMRMSPALALQN